jgi:hypothetical protein
MIDEDAGFTTVRDAAAAGWSPAEYRRYMIDQKVPGSADDTLHHVFLINYVAAAMRKADGNHTMGTGQLAEVAVDAVQRFEAKLSDIDEVLAEVAVDAILKSVVERRTTEEL